jgi:hypothetical protein
VAEHRPGPAAWAATRNKTNYLHAQFIRLRTPRGPHKAIITVAASILTAVYYFLREYSTIVNLEHSASCALIRSVPFNVSPAEFAWLRSRNSQSNLVICFLVGCGTLD